MLYYRILVNNEKVNEYSEDLLTEKGLNTTSEKLSFVKLLSQPYKDMDSSAYVTIVISSDPLKSIYYTMKDFNPIVLN